MNSSGRATNSDTQRTARTEQLRMNRKKYAQKHLDEPIKNQLFGICGQHIQGKKKPLKKPQ